MLNQMLGLIFSSVVDDSPPKITTEQLERFRCELETYIELYVKLSKRVNELESLNLELANKKQDISLELIQAQAKIENMATSHRTSYSSVIQKNSWLQENQQKCSLKMAEIQNQLRLASNENKVLRLQAEESKRLKGIHENIVKQLAELEARTSIQDNIDISEYAFNISEVQAHLASVRTDIVGGKLNRCIRKGIRAKIDILEFSRVHFTDRKYKTVKLAKPILERYVAGYILNSVIESLHVSSWFQKLIRLVDFLAAQAKSKCAAYQFINELIDQAIKDSQVLHITALHVATALNWNDLYSELIPSISPLTIKVVQLLCASRLLSDNIVIVATKSNIFQRYDSTSQTQIGVILSAPHVTADEENTMLVFQSICPGIMRGTEVIEQEVVLICDINVLPQSQVVPATIQ
ncbi:hypothetical protein K7432_005076 [Basidiobolus ranarum]|uniref:Uncharacterized protein n=1 Tax=Basidiobolus ranarum TaxID=34480 RepID=A0ABR2WX92_9FUNG